jgi:hypothetical protein
MTLTETLHYQLPTDPDDSWVEVTISREGVIVTRWDDGGQISTFGRMFEELVPPREE